MSKDKKVRRIFEYENCTQYSDLPSDTRVLVDTPRIIHLTCLFTFMRIQ